MQHLTLWQIEQWPWYAFFIVWAMGVWRLKVTKATEPNSARLVSLILIVCAFGLLFSHYSRIGILGERAFPRILILEWIGVVLTFLGMGLAIWARIILGQNWSGRPTLKVGHELIQSGPYAYVRHPIYTGLLLAVLGTGIVINEWRGVVAILLILIGNGLQAKKEEQLMTTEFGADYQRYRERTGFLIPGL